MFYKKKIKELFENFIKNYIQWWLIINSKDSNFGFCKTFTVNIIPMLYINYLKAMQISQQYAIVVQLCY